MSGIRCLALAACAGLVIAGRSEAGMPSFTLSDVPTRRTLSLLVRHRLEVISFFGLVLLLSAGAIRWIWNSLRRDFPRLPRLSYGKALGVVLLWGLLFLLVLTMISGARELMTPGAWKKDGFTYQLAPELTPEARRELARYRAMERFRDTLFESARADDPDRDYDGPHRSKAPFSRIPEETWIVPESGGQRYLLTVGSHSGEPDAIRAYEPEGVGPYRLVLWNDGAIRSMTGEEIERALKMGRGG